MPDILIRNSDNVVLETGLDGTLTAGTGETVFTETATFIPSYSDVTWQRTGVSTYIIINSETGPLSDNDSPQNQGTSLVVSSNDTTSGTLDEKILITANSGLTKSIANPSGDEDLSLSVNISGVTALGSTPAGADFILLQTSIGNLIRHVTYTQLLAGFSATDSVTYNGGVRDVDANQTVNATWGNNRTGAGPTLFRNGNIIGFSVTNDTILTAGTITCQMSVNGTSQNGPGQIITLNNANQNGFLDLAASPIAVTAGDVVDVSAIADNAVSPNNSDITVTVVVTI